MPATLRIVLAVVLIVGPVSSAQSQLAYGLTTRVFNEIARTNAVLERGPTPFDECSLVKVLGDSAVNELRGRLSMVQPARRAGAECVIGSFTAIRLLQEFIREPGRTIVRTEYITPMGNAYEEYELVRREGALFVLSRKQWAFVERH